MFGAVENFERALMQTHTDPKTLIIRMHHVPFIDITGMLTLKEVITKLHERGVRVLLSEPNGRVLDKLRTAGVLDALPPGWHAHSFQEALALASPPGAGN